MKLAPLFCVVASACTGVLGQNPGSSPLPSPAGATGNPGSPPSSTVGERGFEFEGNATLTPRLRLKSNAEIYASIRDVFAVTVQDESALPPETVELETGFSNNSDAHQMGESRFIALQSLASKVSPAIADGVLFRYCNNPNTTGTACGLAFVKNYGKALLSRDVTDAELATLMKVHAASYVVGADKAALATVAEALLQFPGFLYRTEAGTPSVVSPNSPLTGYERAAALASFFWQSAPDTELLAAAASGKLADTSEVEKQARRLAADPKARVAFAQFALQWLDIRKIELQTRDVQEFPGFSPEVAQAMLEETRTFAKSTVFDGDGSLKTLLAGKTTFLNKTLSDFYGFGSASSTTFVSTALPPLKQGILSHGSFMLAHAGDSQTSPIKRGAFVRTRLLCNTIAPAPDNAPTVVDPAGAGQSVQDVFNQDRQAACAGCHKLMNPIGFGFENIDAVGRTRTTYNGLTIDSSGEILSPDFTSSRPFGAGTGLFETLSTMRETSDCFTLRMYQFALGRAAGKQDQEALEQLAAKFRTTQGHIVNLMVDIATSPSFLSRSTL
jgi:Protein of unknown function (DUF1592)/Protein of unknown function (DUF1588)/Protein of unknown function (DUF1585)/Protein of unknown function (DUF1587)